MTTKLPRWPCLRLQPDSIRRSTFNVRCSTLCLLVRIVAITSVAVIAALSSARAEDRVTVRGSTTSARLTFIGTVEDYTGVELVLRSENEPPRKIPAADVIEVRTPQTEAHTRAIKLLSAGKTDDAIAELETAVKKETRPWVRREILSLQVRAALRRGDYASAGSRFLFLTKSDPSTRHFRVIPLVWAPEKITPDAHDAAAAWMAGASEPGRLIGASLLYADRELGREARAVLKKLASSTDPRVQAFAQMQAWRDEVFGGNPGKLQTAQWQRRVEDLPEDLRAGPSYLLGRAYVARHDYELAAATLLWLPLVDDHDHRLAARACLEAGAALDKIGQKEEARTLYREVQSRFSDTPFADEATQLLAAPENEK